MQTGFFLPVRVLSRLFRRRFLEELQRLHAGGKPQFFGEQAALADAPAFKRWLAPMRRVEWVVYAKRPFAGPQSVLAYLSRYTHRVAISNSRLLAMDERGVTLPRSHVHQVMQPNGRSPRSLGAGSRWPSEGAGGCTSLRSN